MARFNKIQTLTAMTGTGMVPVFYNSDIEVCKKVLKACYHPDGCQLHRRPPLQP